VREKKSEREIARITGLSRNTVAKWLHGELVEPKYRRAGLPNKLAPFVEVLQQALAADAKRPRHERRTAKSASRPSRSARRMESTSSARVAMYTLLPARSASTPRAIARWLLPVPGLWFSERELYSLLMAHQLLGELDSHGVISRHLQPLLDRIHQMLGAQEADAKELLKRVRIIGFAKRPVPSQFFELIAEALLKRRRLHMRYLTRGRGEVSERDVSPQRLVHYRSTWYLDAWCHTKDKVLRFALDAVQEASALEVRAKDVPAKQLAADMDRGYGIYADAKPEWVTLAFSAQAAQWVSREEWHPDQRGEWLPALLSKTGEHRHRACDLTRV
jgi:transcriptional regulator with XRE-family HTH domain